MTPLHTYPLIPTVFAFSLTANLHCRVKGIRHNCSAHGRARFHRTPHWRSYGLEFVFYDGLGTRITLPLGTRITLPLGESRETSGEGFATFGSNDIANRRENPPCKREGEKHNVLRQQLKNRTITL